MKILKKIWEFLKKYWFIPVIGFFIWLVYKLIQNSQSAVAIVIKKLFSGSQAERLNEITLDSAKKRQKIEDEHQKELDSELKEVQDDGSEKLKEIDEDYLEKSREIQENKEDREEELLEEEDITEKLKRELGIK